MKRIFVNIALFFQKISFVYRLIGIGVASFMVLGKAIPDIKFNMIADKAVEMTFDELMKTPADSIPRYVKIKEAVVPSDSYVETRMGKEKSLVGIYYPVYPSANVQTDLKSNTKIEINDTVRVVTDLSGKASLLKNTDKIYSKLVIYDTKAHGSEWISPTEYFRDPKFIIEGRYDGEKLGENVKKLFAEAGLNVSPDAIVLNKGEKGMKTVVAMYWVVIGLFVMLFGTTSFIPGEILKRWIK